MFSFYVNVANINLTFMWVTWADFHICCTNVHIHSQIEYQGVETYEISKEKTQNYTDKNFLLFEENQLFF